MTVNIFPVVAKGVGRVDYSSAVEVTVEPVISSWQSVYSYSARLPAVPAEGNETFIRYLNRPLVAILYDFFLTIPANRLIRLVIEVMDTLGNLATVVDQSGYQTIQAHISKGAYFVNELRLTAYNYAPYPEEWFYAGFNGIYTTLEQFKIGKAITPPMPPGP